LCRPSTDCCLSRFNDVILDKPRSGAIRDPCHDGSEELARLELAAREVATQCSQQRHGMDRRVKPGDDE
jgi:hypothetical protein